MNRLRFITLFASLCLVVVSAFAADSGADIRRRMEQRLPVIDRLKTAEAIGENNRGLLEVRGSGGAEAGTVVAICVCTNVASSPVVFALQCAAKAEPTSAGPCALPRSEP